MNRLRLRATRGLIAMLMLAHGVSLTACAGKHAGATFATTVDPTGCTVEQVTTGDVATSQFQGVSPDGERLAVAWRDGEDENGDEIGGAYLLNLRTSERRTLPAELNNVCSFSPDGRFLVGAHRAENGRTDIVELDLDTMEMTTIAQHERWDWLPSYSPDGRRILFNTDRFDGQMEVVVYERATGDLEQITTYGGYDAHAQFSSDGRRIILNRAMAPRDDGGYDYDVIVVDLDSGDETTVAGGPHEESYGAFAPDGERIVFSSDIDEAPEKRNLFVREADGSTTQLTDGDWSDEYAYWTRDGKYIYFNSDRSGVVHVYRIKMNGVKCGSQETTHAFSIQSK